ncbi:type III-B CRISPR module RAMP protein Cmr4 [Wukongibacter sp. M2B1]|uniref:type III-B CRISPR module RAMP protein Cmr4 n=1 Tax=Wukongibacter sp. M2B1 TaxID=3088895 RepID=UPI003D7B8161
MYSSSTPIIIKAVTPVHAGIGRELGLVDMPIQRESHTGIPKIEGSTIKGSMREMYRLNNEGKVKKLFGHDDGDKGAGIIGFSDGKLLLYPVKSLNNLFTYITCPYLLNRFIEDLDFLRSTDKRKYSKVEINIKEGHVILLNDNKEKDIVLDVYKFEQMNNKEDLKDIREILLHKLYIKRNVAILCDEDFAELISLNREIVTRNKIKYETGIVEDGALFTEEYLPAESILYSLLLVNGILENTGKNKNLVEDYKNKDLPSVLQVGGNKTIGKGIVRISKILDGGE